MGIPVAPLTTNLTAALLIDERAHPHLLAAVERAAQSALMDSVSEPLHVLIVDDMPLDAKLIAHELRNTGHAIEWERVDNATDMRAALDSKWWDLIISDWSMPQFDALAALSVVKAIGLDIPFIIVSGTIGEEWAVEAMRMGAHDYVLKDKLARLAPAVERELRERSMREARRQAELALRHSEAQLRQAQKMEAIGRLAGGIAHDFNNLLSVIIGYSDMLLADLSPDHHMRSDLEEIQMVGERAAELTRQLLAFSRQQVLQPRLVNLNDIMTKIEKMLRRVIGEDVDLSMVGAPNLTSVKVDPGQIEQIIMNLTVNARDAMPQGGKLMIEAANVDLDEAYATDHAGVTPGHYVMLAVTDTGTGMDAATQAGMFEPFFTTKELGKGTGLGLATIYGIVKQSGGNIWVHSELGKGTTFKIYFPQAGADVEAVLSAQIPTSGTMHGSETVLLVEDDERVRGVMRTILRRYGYHVLEAQSGDDALLIGEQHPATIHLLLTDVVMPRMSGQQLAERLICLCPRTKVLYMSGHLDNSIIHHGVLDADIAFIQKPITPEALAKKVRQVLDMPERVSGPLEG